jgi:hypothetical protein
MGWFEIYLFRKILNTKRIFEGRGEAASEPESD